MGKIRLLIGEFFRTLSFGQDRTGESVNSGESDTERIMVASRLLYLSEFRFFSLSYLQWYGHSISDSSLEDIFSMYMFEERVPHWVRHFSRIILKSYESGSLDPSAYNPGIYSGATPEMRDAGIGYTIILAIITVIFCIMVSGYGPV